MFGVKMRHTEDVGVLELLETELVEDFMDDRDELRRIAKLKIDVCQLTRSETSLLSKGHSSGPD